MMAKIIPLKNGTRKDAITTIASRLFKEKGYSATSMRELAEAIGVEAPSLYNHIGSKKEILHEICKRIASIFIAHITNIELSDKPVIDKIEAITRFHIRMMFEEYEQVYLSDHEWKHLDEPYLTDFKNQRRNYRKRFAAIVREGIKSLEIKDIDPYVVVLTILSSVGGIESWQRSKKTISSSSLMENMVRILIEGIRK